jgi:hypothetical protein
VILLAALAGLLSALPSRLFRPGCCLRLLLSATTLLTTLTALLTTLVLLAWFLFVWVHDCSVVAPQSTTKMIAIKFPRNQVPSR